MPFSTLAEGDIDGQDSEGQSCDYESPSMGLPSDAEKLGQRLMACLRGNEGTFFLPVDSQHVRAYSDEDEYAKGMVMRFGDPGIQIQRQLGISTALAMSVKPDGRVVCGDAYDPKRVEIFLTTPLSTS